MNLPAPELLLPRDDRPRWTAAALFRTYRYWALVLLAGFHAMASSILATLIPLWIRRAQDTESASFEVVNRLLQSHYLGMEWGWLLGALLAIVTARKGAWWVLTTLTAIAGLTVLGAIVSSLETALPILLTLNGMAQGAFNTALIVVAACVLMRARLGRLDFAAALCLIVALPAIIRSVCTFLTGYAVQQLGMASGFQMVAIYFAIALICILPAKQLAFDDQPPEQGISLRPRTRSPIGIALLGLLFSVASSLLFLVALMHGTFPFSDDMIPPTFIGALVVAALAGAIYLGYWFYRIHGELAARLSTPRLLSSLSALFIALLVPLGAAIVLIILADVLNRHARDQQRASAVSLGWLLVWLLILPPVAMGMVQHAANGALARD